jgi:hypothetical protein
VERCLGLVGGEWIEVFYIEQNKNDGTGWFDAEATKFGNLLAVFPTEFKELEKG